MLQHEYAWVEAWGAAVLRELAKSMDRLMVRLYLWPAVEEALVMLPALGTPPEDANVKLILDGKRTRVVISDTRWINYQGRPTTIVSQDFHCSIEPEQVQGIESAIHSSDSDGS